jgi:anti-sigma factor RsiW
MNVLNEFRLDPNDPRLTAYALDELDGEERARVAAAVASDPSLQAAVDEIRATAGQLTAALKAEPLPAPARPVHLEPYHTVRPARMFPFPYWAVASLAAAACFVVFVALRQLPFSNQELPQKAEQLAKNAGEAKKSAESQIAGQQQASNHVEIVFSTTGRDALAASGGPTDEWGVIVPNAPQTAAAAATGTEAGAPNAVMAGEKSAPGSSTAAAPSRGRPPGYSDVVGAGLDHAFLPSTQNPLSSFPLDAGSSGYADVRRHLLDGRRPPRAVVRLEELVNYFAYDYTAPKPEDKEPIAASLEVASAPWEPLHRLVRIALKARERPAGERVAVAARNVAVQVEFNPAQVQAYRLLGYENPGQGRENRDSDKSDTIDLESGHTVTAFYEVVPADRNRNAETGDRNDGLASALETISPASGIHNPVSKGLLTVKIRYQAPDADESRLLEFPLTDKGAAFADASSDFRFAAAVAEFGLVLRDSPYKSGANLADVLRWAGQATGPDPGGARSEFISLVKRAETILPSQG